jgi:hypothetical protein
MKTYGERMALDGDERSASCLGRFTPGKHPPVPIGYGAWFGPEVRLDAVEKTEILHLSEIEPLSRRYTDPAIPTSYNKNY